MTRRTQVTIIILLLSVITISAFIFAYYRFSPVIAVENQPVTDNVLFKHIRMPKPGYVVVSQYDQKHGYIPVIISDYLYPEDYRDIRIPLSEQFYLYNVPLSERLRIQIYEDKGDRVFEGLGNEDLYKGLQGNTFEVYFNVLSS